MSDSPDPCANASPVRSPRQDSEPESDSEPEGEAEEAEEVPPGEEEDTPTPEEDPNGIDIDNSSGEEEEDDGDHSDDSFIVPDDSDSDGAPAGATTAAPEGVDSDGEESYVEGKGSSPASVSSSSSGDLTSEVGTDEEDSDEDHEPGSDEDGSAPDSARGGYEDEDEDLPAVNEEVKRDYLGDVALGDGKRSVPLGFSREEVCDAAELFFLIRGWFVRRGDSEEAKNAHENLIERLPGLECTRGRVAEQRIPTPEEFVQLFERVKGTGWVELLVNREDTASPGLVGNQKLWETLTTLNNRHPGVFPACVGPVSNAMRTRDLLEKINSLVGTIVEQKKKARRSAPRKKPKPAADPEQATESPREPQAKKPKLSGPTGLYPKMPRPSDLSPKKPRSSDSYPKMPRPSDLPKKTCPSNLFFGKKTAE